jgi:CheY-like chemotaxis protein
MIDKEFLKTLTILYVEDDLTIQKSLSSILSKVFGKVYICNNGFEGIAQFKSAGTTINAVISDINMPQMNGIEMTRAIRELNPDIPILFTTAHGESHYLMDAIKLKVSHYALKPINTAELLHSISELCLSEHNKQLLEKKSLEISAYTDILDQLAIIFHTDQEGRITFANQLACGISEYPLLELQKSTITTLFHKDSLLNDFQALKKQILDTTSLKKKIKFISKNNTVSYLNLTMIPQYNDSSNELEKFIYIGFDQTAQELEKQQTMQRVRKNMIDQRSKESDLQKKISQLQEEIKAIHRNIFDHNDTNMLMEKLSKEKLRTSKLSNQVAHYEQQMWMMEKEKEKIKTQVEKKATPKKDQKNKELQKLQGKVIEQQSLITKLENQIKKSKYV